MPEARMDKDTLRRQMRARRKALSEEEQRVASQGVLKQLKQYKPYRTATCILAYAACRGELDLTPVLEALWAEEKMVLLPRCGALGEMSVHRVWRMTDLAVGAYGILEPNEECPRWEPDRIDLMLVPGTAFDPQGGRLGQGGGYYDRFMPQTRAIRVGVCHEFACVPCVPRQEHDWRMDAVITPEQIWENGGIDDGYGK